MEETTVGPNAMDPNYKPDNLITCDQEAWVLARLRTLTIMENALRTSEQCGADETAGRCALKGAINGTAIEIIHTLGLEPCYENIARK